MCVPVSVCLWVLENAQSCVMHRVLRWALECSVVGEEQQAWKYEKEKAHTEHTSPRSHARTHFPPQYSFVVITRLDLLREDRETHQTAKEKDFKVVLRKMYGYACTHAFMCAWHCVCEHIEVHDLSYLLVFIMIDILQKSSSDLSLQQCEEADGLHTLFKHVIYLAWRIAEGCFSLNSNKVAPSL